MEKKSQISEQIFSEGKALMQCCAMYKIEFHAKKQQFSVALPMP